MTWAAGHVPDAAEWAPVVDPNLDACEISTAGILQSGITTETTITKMTIGPVTVTNGTLYRFLVRMVLQNSVSTDEFLLRVRKGTALTGTAITELPIYRPAHTAGYAVAGWMDWGAAADETTSFYFSLLRMGGSGNITIYGQIGSLGRTAADMDRVGSVATQRIVP